MRILDVHNEKNYFECTKRKILFLFPQCNIDNDVIRLARLPVSYCSLVSRHTLSLIFIPINSLAPGRSGCDSKNGIFSLVLLIGIFRSSHDNALRWMPRDLTDVKSTLVQVMAWCRQATSHYLSQCWLISLSPYGVARPQWVNAVYSLAVSQFTLIAL